MRDRQTGKLIDIHTENQDRLTDRQTDRQTDKQTNRQTDGQSVCRHDER